MKRTVFVLLFALCLIFVSTAAFAFGTRSKKSCGQTVYIPAVYNDFGYTHPQGHDITQFIVTTVIIRNMNPDVSITVNNLKFYAPNGDPVKEFVGSPFEISGWNSVSYNAGPTSLGIWPPYAGDGGRPFFILEWEAEGAVIPAWVTAAIAVIAPEEPFGHIKSLHPFKGEVIGEKEWWLCN